MDTGPPLTPDDLVDALLLSDAVKQADFPQSERAGDLLRRLAESALPSAEDRKKPGNEIVLAIWNVYAGARPPHNPGLFARLLKDLPGGWIRDGIPALAREIARLDALCRAHGIDPEP